MKKVMNMSEVVEYTSLSRATINRRREIGDFPEPVELTSSRIAFFTSDIEQWLEARTRKSCPEVNDNKRRVRCPQTPKNLRRLAYRITLS